MNIIVRGRNVPVSDDLDSHCYKRIRRAVQPFSERVVRVEVVLMSLSPLHGKTRAGCRVFVTLESGERLMFASSERDYYRAATSATFGAGRHLARMVDKWRTYARVPVEPLGAA